MNLRSREDLPSADGTLYSAITVPTYSPGPKTKGIASCASLFAVRVRGAAGRGAYVAISLVFGPGGGGSERSYVIN